MLAVLVQIDGYDPVAAAAVTLYAGSHDDPSVCHLNGLTWLPGLAKLPTLRYDLFDGSFGGAITTPSSSLTLQAEPWPNLGRYMLADARLRLWTGNVGDPWSSYTLRFDGRITGQPKLQDGKAEIGFAVNDRWLDTAFLTTYAGTTGIEGPAGLKGQVKPLALGAPRYVPGKLIDSVNSVFQVSAYGAVQSIDTALERLARFGAAAGDYASYAALVAATLAPGTWATCKATGLARFGAPPTGQISFLLSGDAAGTDGWARKPGQLIRRIALLSGGTGKVNDTSLNALDTARPYNVSLYLDEQTTAREVIQKLAASVNAVAGVSWTGQLFVLPVAIGAATTTFAADGSALPPVASVQQVEIAAPFQKLALTAERAWTVHQLSDIAFTATLIDLGGYLAGTTYREGNIVELPSGARYMYSNVTPTAGNSPPNATYWTALPVAASTDFANVTGTTKPDANATRNDNGANLIAAPADPTSWRLSNGAIVAYPTTGRARAQLYTAAAIAFFGPSAVKCTPGVPLNVRYVLKADTPNANTVNASVVWQDASGTTLGGGVSPQNLSDRSVTTLSAANAADLPVTFTVTPPAGAYRADFYVERPSVSAAGSMYADQFYVSEVQYRATNGATWDSNIAGQPTVADGAGTTVNLTPIGSAPAAVTVKGNAITAGTSPFFGACAVGTPFYGPCQAMMDVKAGSWNMLALDDDTSTTDYSTQQVYAQYNSADGLFTRIYLNGTQVAFANIAANLTGKMILAFDGLTVQLVIAGVVQLSYAAPAYLLGLNPIYPKFYAYSGGTYTGLDVDSYIDSRGKQKLDLATGQITSPTALPPITSANLGYKFSVAPTYTATTTSATISVGAGSLLMGSTTKAYSAMSVGVSGTAGTSTTFQLYVQETSATDSSTWGGSKTLIATATGSNVYSDDRNVFIGTVTVAFPASGTGSGSGGGGGGGGPGNGFPIP